MEKSTQPRSRFGEGRGTAQRGAATYLGSPSKPGLGSHLFASLPPSFGAFLSWPPGGGRKERGGPAAQSPQPHLWLLAEKGGGRGEEEWVRSGTEEGARRKGWGEGERNLGIKPRQRAWDRSFHSPASCPSGSPRPLRTRGQRGWLSRHTGSVVRTPFSAGRPAPQRRGPCGGPACVGASAQP